MEGTPLLAVPLLALACGSPLDRASCAADADCAPGTRCQATSAGGVCWPANTLGLEAPAAGAKVGLAGAAAGATLVLGKPGSTAPPSVDLLADGVPVASLLPGSRVPGSVTYEGRYQPAAATDRPVALVARAVVDGEAVASPPLTVAVDTVSPALAILGASCPPRPADCERDGVLLVRAGASADAASVEATLDLDPARSVALVPRGGEYQAEVRLGEYPFPAFGRAVQVQVTARDAAGNRTETTQAVSVTRLRWASPAESGSVVPLTGVAVDGAGNAVAGGGNGKLYVYAPDGRILSSPVVGTGSIASAPSIGPTAIWVASQDGRIYAVDGTGAVLNGGGCATSSVPTGTPALSSGSPELSFTGTTTAKALFAARVAGALCDATTAGDGFVSSAVVGPGGAILSATATPANAVSVRRFSDPGTGFLTSDWSVAAGSGVEAPLALDGSGRVLVSSSDGTLYRVTDLGAAGSAAAVATVSGRALESALVLAGGDVVLGTAGGKVHRLAEGGGAVWASPPDLGADVTGLAAASPGGARDPVLYAVTVLGDLFALRADGSVAWSHPVAAGALRFPAVAPAAAGRLPTLYAGSADGRLYAVVVDTGLDAAAPWPKSHHDLRNTGNLASPLP